MLATFAIPLMSLFVLGGGLWFLWLFLLFTLCSFSMYHDRYQITSWLVVLGIVAWLVFGDLWPILSTYEWNWQAILAFIGSFILAGACWGFGKWGFFLMNRREEFTDVKIHWLRKQGISGINVPDEHKKEFQKYLAYNTIFHNRERDKDGHFVAQVKPNAWDYREDIIAWMAYWPFSIIETLLGDVLRLIFRRLQSMFSGLMNAMSNAVFSGVENDYTVKNQDE